MSISRIFPNSVFSSDQSRPSRKRSEDFEDDIPHAKKANTASQAPVIENRRVMPVVKAAMPKLAPHQSQNPHNMPFLTKRLVEAYASKNDDSDGENGDLSEEGSDDDIKSVNKAFSNTRIV